MDTFTATVRDAGGGIVDLLIDEHTAHYPSPGDRVRVESAEPGPRGRLDPTGHWPLVVTVYRCAVRLMCAGVFTNQAILHAIPFSGYRIDEVDDALEVMVAYGDLSIVEADLGPGVVAYTAGRAYPVHPVEAS